MKLAVLGSGSKGQAVYVAAGKTRVLFDAGFSALEVKRRLASIGVDIAELDAVVISHEHSDHVAALRVLGKKLPVYATRGTVAELRVRYELTSVEIIAAGDQFTIGDITVLPISVSHDAAEPVAFAFHDGRRRAAIVTDLGAVTRPIRHHLHDLDLVVIETNHDLNMLMSGPYPWELKQRIKSNQGHLSNSQAASLASDIVCRGLKKIFLAHLSETNNLPKIARDEIQFAIDGAGCQIQVCSQDRCSDLISVK